MDGRSRDQIARKRLLRILDGHGVANARTLEQKISDAGPYGQRIDPHVLTRVRNELVKEGRIAKILRHNAPWFHLPETATDRLQKRLDEQLAIFRALQHRYTGSRIGQCLEIAIYRSLLEQTTLEHFGGFTDLTSHDDSTLYSKDEPPQAISGRRLPGNQRLDFLVRHPQGGWAGIEAKNVREWLYPDRDELADLVAKCVALDCVPGLIARRVPFVTFKLLSICGVVFHQTYNQLFPEADRELAEKARHRENLGYHDIRLGNAPDDRLKRFIGTNLPGVLLEARRRFDDYKDLLEAFGDRSMRYTEFAARVRRRSEGRNEDADWEPPADFGDWYEP